jgi:hypothetical protein
MTPHKGAIVQLTRDFKHQGQRIRSGTIGCVLSRVALRHVCMVEFAVDGRNIVAMVNEADLAVVQPNVRV